MIRAISCGFLAAIVAASAVAAADPLAEMRACATQSDNARRLACYDAAMNKAPETASPVAVAAATAPASTPSAEQSFGYRGDVARQEIEQKEAQEPPQLEQLEATISALERQPRGEFVVTLDNGQVWAQKAPESKVRPQVGDVITIKAGTFGSFVLVTANGRSTRVSRVR